ncbi:MAG: PqqD family peptide modification chaperone [Xanthobacteraceae bacterium]
MTETSTMPARAGTPSRFVRRFPVRGGLLLLDTSTNTLLAYNDVAREVWDMVEAGRSQANIVAAVAGSWGIAAALAQRDVQAILDMWRSQGLLVGATEPVRVPSIAAVETAEPHAPPSEWVCTIRGVVIAFSITAELQGPAYALFRHLETPAATPQVRMEVRRASSLFAFREDGRERLRSGDAAVVIGALHVAVLERVRPGIEWFALIHGAALARGAHGIALLGSSGSGKSTLAAALMRSGFGFLSDDIVPLAAPDTTIVPWPLPLSLKPGGVDALLARIPELAAAPRYRTKGLEARTLAPPPQAWDAEPAKLRQLFFPCFREGAAPEARRLSPFEALERLLSDRVWLGDPITEERVTSFLGWLDRTPAHALTYGALDDALELVESVIP